MSIIVQANELTRYYPMVRSDPLIAVKTVDLQLHRGKLAVITGPSGSGKTTLLNLLAGLDRPNHGQIELMGNRLADLSDAAVALLRRHHVGMVFQDFKLLPDLSAWENVALPLIVLGWSRSERRARACEQLEELGVGDTVERRVRLLSGGQQQRVALARALVNHPDLLLADEPTSQIDDQSAACVIGAMNELIGQDKSVLVTTHDRNVPWPDAQRYTMEGGTIAVKA